MPDKANGSELRGWAARIIPILLFSDNWLSRAGIFLVTSATVFWFWMLGLGSTAGYTDIIQYVLLPALFFVGLALIPAGVAMDRRQRPSATAGVADFSWKSEAAKKLLIFVGTATVLNVILGATFSYRAVHYMEGNSFCGTACHSVMSPEFTAYKATAAHSRVDCVACHVGPGAANFVEAKLNGTRQLLLIMTGHYQRPIAPPIDRMHAAKDTCGTCHSEITESPGKLKIKSKFSDEGQLTKTALVMKIGGAKSGKGIHGAHLGAGVKISYAAAAADRSSFAWVSSTKAGVTDEYFAPGKNQASIAGLKQRDMSCLDCHNRPSHQFELPAAAVDKAMMEGTIATTLPGIKKVAVDLLGKQYKHPENEISAALQSHYKQSGAPLDLTAKTVAAIYSRNVYPQMNITWGTYPNHIGHTDSPGCFRCHGSDLTSSNGKQIAQDCSSCHQVLAVDEATPKILEDLGTGQ